MAWTCPNCQKEFRNKNQWHSCARVDIDKHFLNKAPSTKTTFDALMNIVNEFGPVTVDSIKTAIQLRCGATFLSITPKKNYLELAFSLPYSADEFPVFKTIRVSSKRVLHYLVLEDVQEIDEQLKSWLKQAYDLIYHAEQ